MKVNELIEILKSMDPEGELEVMVWDAEWGAQRITDVSKEIHNNQEVLVL